jgi:glycosyltransferase A (GT-A) superfamily protein (DUF2064 family)
VTSEAFRSNTAILFFSHRPEREWQNKRLVRQDYAKSRAVAEAFYRHTRAAVRESDFPVLEVTDAHQRGDRFGARLANAFADAFAAGYDRVIAVGSDCPRLHEVDWSDVARRVEKGAPVLGPTPSRDGVYLIGLHRSQFDAEAFAALPWKMPDLFSALARHLSEQAGTAPDLLAARDDVNGHWELLALIRRPGSLSRRLLAVLRAVLGAARKAARSHRFVQQHPVCGHRTRAPPSPFVSTG